MTRALFLPFTNSRVLARCIERTARVSLSFRYLECGILPLRLRWSQWEGPACLPQNRAPCTASFYPGERPLRNESVYSLTYTEKICRSVYEVSPSKNLNIGSAAVSSIYSPLPDGCIRLLTIYPRQDTELVTCSLRVEKLDVDCPPQYEALSYVWGPSDPKFPILLNGHAHLIHINLFNFLVHQPQHDSIWIDALCINQDDIDERSRQVQMMGDIYRYAERVLVWLGLALDNRLASWIGKPEQALRANFDSYTAFQQTLDNLPYWNRVWILQEFLLAREILFVYGVGRVSFADLNRVLSDRPHGSPMAPGQFSNVWSLCKQRTNPDRISLKELSELTQHRQCKESHDRVYSLLHLASEQESKSIIVDYKQDNITLYAAVMHSITLQSWSTLKFAIFLRKLLQVKSSNAGQTTVLENRQSLAERISLGQQLPLRVLLHSRSRIERVRKLDLRLKRSGKRSGEPRYWHIGGVATEDWFVLGPVVYQDELLSFLMKHTGVEENMIDRMKQASQVGAETLQPVFEAEGRRHERRRPQKRARRSEDNFACYLVLHKYYDSWEYACRFEIANGDIRRGDKMMCFDDCDLNRCCARKVRTNEVECRRVLTACWVKSEPILVDPRMNEDDFEVMSEEESNIESESESDEKSNAESDKESIAETDEESNAETDEESNAESDEESSPGSNAESVGRWNPETDRNLSKTYTMKLDAYAVLSLIAWPSGGDRPMNTRVYRRRHW